MLFQEVSVPTTGLSQHLLQQGQGLADMVPGREFRYYAAVFLVYSHLAVECVRQQALLAVEQCDTRFITGSFETENAHLCDKILSRSTKGRMIIEGFAGG